MKTQDDVLSFHDLEVQRILQRQFLAENLTKDMREKTERWIHTFLEWELYDKHIYQEGWTIAYLRDKMMVTSIYFDTIIETLQEAELIAVKKISRFLGEMVHLERINDLEINAYKVLSHYVHCKTCEPYRGVVTIEAKDLLSKSQTN